MGERGGGRVRDESLKVSSGGRRLTKCGTVQEYLRSTGSKKKCLLDIQFDMKTMLSDRDMIITENPPINGLW